MARYNEILVGRYNRFVQKLLSLKGDASLFQFSTEMQGTLNFFSGVENRYLEGWNRFGLLLSITAGAATNSLLRVRNAAGSNVVAVIEKINVTNPTAAAYITNLRSGNLSAADAATLNVGAPTMRLDSRGNPVSSLIISSNAGSATTPASPGSTKIEGGVPVNGTYEFLQFEDQEIPILPGDVVDVFIGTAAVQMDVSWIWRERFLEDSERT